MKSSAPSYHERTQPSSEAGPGPGWSAAALDAIPTGIIVAAADGRIVDLNSATEELFGYGRDRLIGQPVAVVLPTLYPDDGRTYGRRVDGTEFPVDLNLGELEGEQAVVVVVQDVTATADVEARLGFLEAILASSSDAVFSEDRDGLITSWNRGAQVLCGYRTAEISGWRSTRLFAEARWAEYEVLLRRVLAGEVHDNFETEIRRRDGLVVPVQLSVAPIRDAQGRVTGASVIARDVSEQKIALAALAESEARLRERESLARVGGWVLDVGTGAVQWSEELHRIHGMDPVDFGGTLADHVALVHPDDLAQVADALNRAASGEGVVDVEYRVVCADGTTRWFSSRAAPVTDERGKVIGVRGICQDVTERKRATTGGEE